MRCVIVDGHLDTAILRQQLAQELQAWVHHRQPLRMLQIVVVMLEGTLGVVGRVDKDALHLPGIKRQQCFQRIQVIALNQAVGRTCVAMLAEYLQQAIGHC